MLSSDFVPIDVFTGHSNGGSGTGLVGCCRGEVHFFSRATLIGRLVTSMKEWQADERRQIAHSFTPFKGSEAFRDACQSSNQAKAAHKCSYATHTHTHAHTYAHLLPPSLPSLILYTSAFLSSCPVKTLVFHHLGLDAFFIYFFYRGPSSRRSWRVVACTVIVPYLQSAALISWLLCARFLFLPPPPLSPALPSCLLSASLYSYAVAHKKLFRTSASQGRPLAQTDAVGKHSLSTKDLLCLFFLFFFFCKSEQRNGGVKVHWLALRFAEKPFKHKKSNWIKV